MVSNFYRSFLSLSLLCIISFCHHEVFGQEKLLNRKIDGVYYKTPFQNVLADLSKQADFDFAYDATLFPQDKVVSAEWKSTPLRQALDDMLPEEENILYKSIGTQLIFYQKKAPVLQKKNILNGLVIDAQTGRGIAQVSIVDEYLGLLARTNAKGVYQVEIPNPDFLLKIECRKEGYVTKKLKVRLRSDRQLTIGLHAVIPIEPQPIAVIQNDSLSTISVPEEINTIDTLEALSMDDIEPIDRKKADFGKTSPLGENLITLFITETAKNQAEKFSSTLENTTFQFGVVPLLSSNFLENSNSINNVSINLLAGYSAGLKGFELAGIANIERFNMGGVQIAGASNFVNGRSSGLQIATAFNVSKLKGQGVQLTGGVNYTGNHFSGVQLAGGVNVVNGSFTGLQLAGLTNVAKNGGKGWQMAVINNVSGQDRMEGLQMSVFNNSASEFDGTQLAIFRNAVKDSLSGLQMSVYKNIVKGNSSGGQASLLFNTAKGSFTGMQASVFSNVVNDTISGTQLGLFNSTTHLDGLQIGLINSAESVGKGVPIGLLSFVEKGYQRLDLGVHENKFFDVQFKTGLRKFYNILGIGGRYGKGSVWYGGYGFGTAPRLTRNFLGLNFDFAAYYVNENERWFEDHNWLFRNQTNITMKLGKRVVFFTGISINAQWSELRDEDGQQILSKLPDRNRVFHESINEKGQDWTLWRGWQVGLRFGRVH